VWTIDLKSPPGSVSEGATLPAQCTLEMSDADFMDMATGKADAMKLFGTGKLKISGDVMASQKLGFLKKLTPELVLAETDKRLGGSSAAAAPAADVPAGVEPTSWDVFIAIRDHVERHPDMVASIATVFVFKLKDPDSAWTVDMKNGKGSVTEGAGAADCTLEIAERDFLDMTMGKSDPMKLFTTGKLKISGNIMASQKLSFLQKIDPQHAMAAVAKARAAGAGPKAPVASSGGGAAKAPEIFAALTKRLADKPGLKDEVRAKLVFKLTGPDAVWTVDLAGDTPSVKEGASGEVATILTISDADLAALTSGAATARDLFQHGKLRVDGDLTVAHRLGFLNKLV
jgi:3-hydroxyacyl-CoA dehydrogenase/3a,7a,12a-trihydroxy-5b-cholest-24-enoyl-CoA hydratase